MVSGNRSSPIWKPPNLDRVEVLKGPAAILFGRIEPGGMVNLVTKRPLNMPYYSMQQQFGSYGMCAGMPVSVMNSVTMGSESPLS